MHGALAGNRNGKEGLDQRSRTVATVNVRETRVQTPDGAMTTFFATPEGPGPFRTVVVYVDAAGLRDELRRTFHPISDLER